MREVLKTAGRKKKVLIYPKNKTHDFYLIEVGGKFETVSTRELNKILKSKKYDIEWL